MSNKKKKKIDWLNHFVGLVSVVFGVLIAFWLNNWSEERKEQREIKTALQNVRNEISKNQLALDSTITESKLFREFLDQYLNSVDDEMKVVISDAEWEELINKYPLYLKEGTTSIRLSVSLFQLSEVAWTTTHRTGILSSINFELAYQLEETYDLQEKVNEFDNVFIANLRDISGNKDSISKLFRSLSLAIDLATSLMESSYPQSIKAIDSYK